MPKITALRVVARRAPTIENGKVAPPRRQPNRERRTREHLTPHEVDPSVVGRHGHRDRTLVLLVYPPGSGSASLSRSAGSRSTTDRGFFTSTGGRMALPPPIRCAGSSYGP